MTERERYVAALTFGGLERYPLAPGWPRESTLRRWSAEGMPSDVWFMDSLYRDLGIPDERSRQKRVSLDIDFRMVPQFEERLLEHRDGHFVVQDWMGNVTEISDEYDLTYLRTARDFVTRKWHRFPVENRHDWERMKKRYDPSNPARFPADLGERVRLLAQRDYPLGLTVNGPFWQLREWLGFEPLCTLFLTDPDFVAEMIAFWADFVAEMLETVVAQICPDHVQISEDMAFKAHSMISPAMARRFLLPTWTRWTGLLHERGCPVVKMDSDGYIEELIPLWIEAGIDACNPIEVAAHNDIVAFRRRFGRNMAFEGGIDKRLIAQGGSAIAGEVDRVCSLLSMGGGLVPGCDHGVPPDISWPAFRNYTLLLARATGWLRTAECLTV